MAHIIPDGDGVTIVKSSGASLENASLESLKDLLRLAQMGDMQSAAEWAGYCDREPAVARLVYKWAAVEDIEQGESRAHVHELIGKSEQMSPLVSDDGHLITVKLPRDKMTRKGSHLIEIGKDGKRKKARKSRKKAHKAARPALVKSAPPIAAPALGDLAGRDVRNYRYGALDAMISESLASSDPRIREWALGIADSREQA